MTTHWIVIAILQNIQSTEHDSLGALFFWQKSCKSRALNMNTFIVCMMSHDAAYDEETCKR